MLACLDVDYRPDGPAIAACLLFTSWQSASAESSAIARIDDVAPYTPGMFFERELPCLLRVLAALSARPDLVVIDGYVHLDASGRPGLGAFLFDALHREVPVIGVAKTAFRTATTAIPIVRGTGTKPLWVSAAGLDVSTAAARVLSMHGAYRLPTLLRAVDRLARTSSEAVDLG
jgi:deoxyribonuclease V